MNKKIERERADFHVHLGDRTDDDVLLEAANNKVTALGLLDRSLVDTNRLREIIPKGQQQGVTILPGVECLTEIPYNGHSLAIELLGLDFDLQHPSIYHNFDPRGGVYSLRHNQKVSYQKDFLISQGFDLSETMKNKQQWDDILSGKKLDTAVRLCRLAASSPANHTLFQQMIDEIKTHLVKRPQDEIKTAGGQFQRELSLAKFLYWKYFAPGKPGFKKWYLEASVIIKTIHEAGGIVIIPHPKFQHTEPEIPVTNILIKLFDQGIDGIQGWDADRLERTHLKLTLAQQKLILGGSGQDTTYYQNRIMGKGDVTYQRMFISPRRLNDINTYKEKSATR